MSKLFSGSICLTDLVEQAKLSHSAFSRSKKNGKVYLNFKAWLNDEPDKFGNSMSLMLNSKKDFQDTEPKFYIGNAKQMEAKEPKTIEEKDIAALAENMDDLPF